MTINNDEESKHGSSSSELSLDHFMIALYYWYINIPSEALEDQVSFHESLCTNFNLFGRIRISTEGLNGVLSGTVRDLKEYECQIKQEIEAKFRCQVNSNADGDTDTDGGHITEIGLELQYGQTLDVKYCHLRKDIPPEKQLFNSISVKVTKEIVSLNEMGCDVQGTNPKCKNNKRKKKKKRKNKGDRYKQIMEEDRQRKEQEQQEKTQQQQEDCTSVLERQALSNIDKFEPATHLSPREWNEHLLSYHQNGMEDHENNDSTKDAILIDARNIYESKIGYFTSPDVPTLLTNTRKYSNITSVLNDSISHLAGKNVYMYCTGGVRCERASVYLQALANSDSWPEGMERPKEIYQLKGGIQKYLEEFGTLETQSNSRVGGNITVSDEITSTEERAGVALNQKQCLFKGKNFVFDPRRFDPMIGIGIKNDNDNGSNSDSNCVKLQESAIVGRCLVCSCSCDDYDNGYAPCENMEARCCRCRMLILVCNDCRQKVRVWGQEVEFQALVEVSEGGEECRQVDLNHYLPDIYCGPNGKECVNEGNCVDHCEIITY